MSAQSLVDPVQVVEHDVGLWQLTQEAQHRQQLFACDPDHGYAGQGGLDADGIGAELGAELGNDPLVIILVGRYVQCLICSHHEYRYRSTVEYGAGAGTKPDHTSSGVRRLVTWMRWSRFCSRCEGISAR